MQVLHRFCLYERRLWIVQDMSQGVHSHLVVRGVDSHGLLTHSGLVSVSRRLIVVRERNDGGTDSKDHGWVDLQMSVVVALLLTVLVDIIDEHGDHRGLFLFHV